MSNDTKPADAVPVMTGYVEAHRLAANLASGALRTYNPETHVAVPREELQAAVDALKRGFPVQGLYLALPRWLADGNEEASE